MITLGILTLALSAFMIAKCFQINPKLGNVRLYKETLFSFGIIFFVISLFVFYIRFLDGFQEFLINVINYLNSHK